MNVEDTLFGQTYKRIPEYRPDMYKDGWKPWEVYVAFKRKWNREIEERQQAKEAAIANEQQSEAEHITVSKEIYINGKRIQ